MQRPPRICIYAFSSTALFFRGLIDECARSGDEVEWSVVQPQGHFRYVLDGVIPDERRCYLYENFNARYAAASADDLEAALATGAGLIAALAKDKDGYRWLEKGEQLRRGATMHGIYREFLERVRPDYVLFPDLEVVDGFVLMNLCQQLGIPVLYFASLRLTGVSFFARDPYEGLPDYFGAHTEDDLRDARAAIAAFHARRTKGPAAQYKPTAVPKPSWFRRLIVSNWLRWTSERLHASEETFFMRIARHMIPLVSPIRRCRFDLLSSRYFDLYSRDDALPERFVFYALQYTPESSINGLEPYYVDQTRVIDALLLSLPPGYRLVVKEHPAMVGLRPGAFYRDLRRKPGLVLAHPDIDGRWLTERSSLVVTVTGTIGLECYLLGKPCILFGRTAFAHLCYSAPGFQQMREFLAGVIEGHGPATDAEKEREIAKLINIGADFVIGDPWFSPVVMAPENIRAARAHMWKHIRRLAVEPSRVTG